jgi:hypothetical protein
MSTIQVGIWRGWWKNSFVPKMLQSKAYQEVLKAAEERKKQLALQKDPPETPIVFVEVDPAQAGVKETPQALSSFDLSFRR